MLITIFILRKYIGWRKNRIVAKNKNVPRVWRQYFKCTFTVLSLLWCLLALSCPLLLMFFSWSHNDNLISFSFTTSSFESYLAVYSPFRYPAHQIVTNGLSLFHINYHTKYLKLSFPYLTISWLKYLYFSYLLV